MSDSQPSGNSALEVIKDEKAAQQLYRRWRSTVLAGATRVPAEAFRWQPFGTMWINTPDSDTVELRSDNTSNRRADVQITLPMRPHTPGRNSTFARDIKRNVWLLRQGRLSSGGGSEIQEPEFAAAASPLGLAPVAVDLVRGPRAIQRAWYKVALVCRNGGLQDEWLPDAEIQAQTGEFVALCGLVRDLHSSSGTLDGEADHEIPDGDDVDQRGKDETPGQHAFPQQNAGVADHEQGAVYDALKQLCLSRSGFTAGKWKNGRYEIDILI